MIPPPAARRLALASLTLLLAGGCVLPPTGALLRPPDIPSSGGFHAGASAGVWLAGSQIGLFAKPEARVGLRHRLGSRVDAGVSLSLTAGLQLDTVVELYHGAVLTVSVDPRGTLGTNALSPGGTGPTGVETTLSASLPLTFGIHLGPDELVIGPLASRSWSLGAHPYTSTWLGAGVGLDVPVGSVHLLPEVDLAAEPSTPGLNVRAIYFLMSFH